MKWNHKTVVLIASVIAAIITAVYEVIYMFSHTP